MSEDEWKVLRHKWSAIVVQQNMFHQLAEYVNPTGKSTCIKCVRCGLENTYIGYYACRIGDQGVPYCNGVQ